MQSIKRDHEKLSKKSFNNQNQIIQSIDQIIDQLQSLRDQYTTQDLLGQFLLTQPHPSHPARLMISSSIDQESILTSSKPLIDHILSTSTSSSQSALSNHKEFHSLYSKWQKMIDKRFSQTLLPLLGSPSSNQNLEDQKPKRPFESHSARLALDRVIAHHLIRQGRFETAEIFINESGHSIPNQDLETCQSLYRILDSIRSGDLQPALAWVQAHQPWLELRQSSLEFDLRRSQFVRLLTTPDSSDLPQFEKHHTLNMDIDPPITHQISTSSEQRALHQARVYLQPFISTRFNEVIRLTTSVLFTPLSNLRRSPYAEYYQAAEGDDENSDQPWLHAHHLVPLFTQEFYAQLRWSKELPLVVATDLGSGGALAKIAKVRSVMKEKRTEWSQADELPVRNAPPLFFSS